MYRIINRNASYVKRKNSFFLRFFTSFFMLKFSGFFYMFMYIIDVIIFGDEKVKKSIHSNRRKAKNENQLDKM